MIYRPRAGEANRRDLSPEYRHPSIASRRTRGAIVLFPGVLRTGVGDAVRSGEIGRTAGDLRRSEGSASPVHCCLGTEPCDVCGSEACRGNREYAASIAGGVSRSDRAGAGRYTPSVPGSRRGGSDRGGPAIARSERVVRPVRRPTDRQTNRRTGGDPREICNQQVPSREARDFLILRVSPAGTF